jgi:hypothetical protein
MDDFSREILVLSKKMLSELRRLSATLLGVQEQIGSIRDQQKACSQQQKERQQQPPVIQAKLQIPEDVQREKRSSDKRHFAVQVVLAVVTFLTFLAAAIYAGINYHMLCQMKSEVIAANRSADAAKTSSEVAIAELRPWVSAEDISITSPLRFESPKGGLLTIGYVLRNTGHSPALHVMWRSKLVVLSMTKNVTEEISERQATLCDPMLKMSRDLFEDTVFPGDKIPGAEGMGVSPAEIAAAIKSREAGPFKHSGYVSLAMISCIDYQMSLIPQHHQTRYAFTIGIPMTFGGYMGDIRPEDIPSGLRLIYFSQSAD